MQDALTTAQHNLALALLGVRRDPADRSEYDVERLVASLPPVNDDILDLVAAEIDAAASRVRHRNFATFHEYQRCQRRRAGEITPDLLADGIYYRPSRETLVALLEAVDKAACDFGTLRAIREVQMLMKADGVDFDYEPGIVPAAPAAK